MAGSIFRNTFLGSDFSSSNEVHRHMHTLINHHKHCRPVLAKASEYRSRASLIQVTANSSPTCVCMYVCMQACIYVCSMCWCHAIHASHVYIPITGWTASAPSWASHLRRYVYKLGTSVTGWEQLRCSTDLSSCRLCSQCSRLFMCLYRRWIDRWLNRCMHTSVDKWTMIEIGCRFTQACTRWVNTLITDHKTTSVTKYISNFLMATVMLRTCSYAVAQEAQDIPAHLCSTVGMASAGGLKRMY